MYQLSVTYQPIFYAYGRNLVSKFASQLAMVLRNDLTKYAITEGQVLPQMFR